MMGFDGFNTMPIDNGKDVTVAKDRHRHREEAIRAGKNQLSWSSGCFANMRAWVGSLELMEKFPAW